MVKTIQSWTWSKWGYYRTECIYQTLIWNDNFFLNRHIYSCTYLTKMITFHVPKHHHSKVLEYLLGEKIKLFSKLCAVNILCTVIPSHFVFIIMLHSVTSIKYHGKFWIDHDLKIWPSKTRDQHFTINGILKPCTMLWIRSTSEVRKDDKDNLYKLYRKHTDNSLPIPNRHIAD